MEKQATKKVAPRYDDAFKEGAIKMVIEQKLPVRQVAKELAHSFLQEQQTGTIYVLRLYGGAQPVLFGKLLYNLILLTILFLFVVPLFLCFFTVEMVDWKLFWGTLLLGAIGMAVLMTLLSAFLLAAHNQNALFMVISFPILLPLLLFGILLTTQSFQTDTAVNLK